MVEALLLLLFLLYLLQVILSILHVIYRFTFIHAFLVLLFVPDMLATFSVNFCAYEAIIIILSQLKDNFSFLLVSFKVEHLAKNLVDFNFLN